MCRCFCYIYILSFLLLPNDDALLFLWNTIRETPCVVLVLLSYWTTLKHVSPDAASHRCICNKEQKNFFFLSSFLTAQLSLLTKNPHNISVRLRMEGELKLLSLCAIDPSFRPCLPPTTLCFCRMCAPPSFERMFPPSLRNQQSTPQCTHTLFSS